MLVLFSWTIVKVTPFPESVLSQERGIAYRDFQRNKEGYRRNHKNGIKLLVKIKNASINANNQEKQDLFSVYRNVFNEEEEMGRKRDRIINSSR